MTKTQIAVIDDRADARKMVADVVQDAIANLGITNQWAVLSAAPLSKLSGYRNWIAKHNIGILLIDERLAEIPDRSGEVADYTGSDLVRVLRKQNKDMPIYGVTSFPDDPSLQTHFALFNEVIERHVFTAKATQYIDRILRLYQSFLNKNEKELAELSKLSRTSFTTASERS